MDFELSEEQRLLKDSVERLVANRYDFSARQRFMQEPTGFSRELWRQYPELGLLGLPFSEKDGEMGGVAVDPVIGLAASGRALPREPYFATIVLAGGFLRLGATAAVRSSLIPQIVSGDLLLAFAHAERQSRYDLADVAT